ncbi:MAG: ASKHA domain-containing protein [Tissierellia bacterium]|nr:ASKHA domain-containing protein [Tissierellia bacterium]
MEKNLRGSSPSPGLSFQGTKKENLGLAIDLGSTSLALSLWDLGPGGKELAQLSRPNPQLARGLDVISRIHYAHKSKTNLKDLQALALEGINGLIWDLEKDLGFSKEAIKGLVLVANPTLLHLLLGLDPIGLAQAPYKPNFLQAPPLEAMSLGLDLSPGLLLLSPPALSAYVGADLVAGLVGLFPGPPEENFLYLDLGTNVEILLQWEGKTYASSAPAGPALEAMSLTWGMRAGEGALIGAHLAQDPIFLEVLGGGALQGIAGSGLIKLVGDFLDLGLIDATGAFQEGASLPGHLAQRLVDLEGQRVFYLDRKVYLGQKDLRAFQLAKGAISGAIRVLLQEAQVGGGILDRIYVAGALAQNLDPALLKKVGLVPQDLGARDLVLLGNAALRGAQSLLLDWGALDTWASYLEKIRLLELSGNQAFEAAFLEEMVFPSPK